MPTELRCQSRMHAVLTDDGLLEVKCQSKYCGAGRGQIVLHYWDMATLELIETKRFKTPESLFRKAR